MRKYIAYIALLLLSTSVVGQENLKPNLLLALDSLVEQKNYRDITRINKEELNLLSPIFKADALSILAKSYSNINKEDSAFVYYKNALTLYESLELKENIAQTNLDIYYLLDSQNDIPIDKRMYLKAVYDHANETGSKKWFMNYYSNRGVNFMRSREVDSASYYLHKSLKLAENINNTTSIINISISLGSLQSGFLSNNDSALFYYKNAFKSYESDTTLHQNLNTKFYLYNNIGNTYRRKKEYAKSIENYKKAERINLAELDRKSKKVLYSNMDVTYYYMGEWENAYHALYKYDSIKTLINLKEQNTTITDIEEKYNNEKLRADNLETENKRRQNQNIALGLGGILALGSVIAFLVFKNTKRKQKLAEQAKELESQKLATVLKEQELTSIDAMIEGQERERQRIANDLHDDLGGLMATVKLHFNALKGKDSPELYEKTNTLIEEAYQKVRTVAHAKNSGVIAKQGLLKAVQNMADKISASNRIQIDVVDHGLDNRLENSLELTLFRITQELITNVIKHAEATEATIHLTNHEDSINIMVEDNGKGFNTQQITTANAGMGISSIDKRVEHLNGQLTIESEKNKGTTVIIDIPL